MSARNRVLSTFDAFLRPFLPQVRLDPARKSLLVCGDYVVEKGEEDYVEILLLLRVVSYNGPSRASFALFHIYFASTHSSMTSLKSRLENLAVIFFLMEN
jgi:hypothetical protein